MLARSASDLGIDSRFEHSSSPEQPPPLYCATEARRRAEQDAILLANRLRLLRAEDEKAKKKTRDTEKRTQEIIELRRRNEERRLAREAEDQRREVETHEARNRQMRWREEQQKKILANQRSVHEQKATMFKVVKQEREEHRQIIREEQEDAKAEVAARAERVRRAQLVSERRRAKSEDARLESIRGGFQERLQREEQERQSKMQMISKMEKEEADLLSRLQRSQERHRAAYAQLEDVINGGSAAATPSGSRCNSSLEERLPLDQAVCSTGSNQPGARPPRPRVAAAASGSTFGVHGAAPAASSRSRPGSAPRRSSAPPPRMSQRPPVPMPSASGNAACRAPANIAGIATAVAAKKSDPRRDHSTASICSTASGPCTESGRGSTDVSGHSTPSSARAQFSYTTVDGQQLEIPVEEDLDLDQLLNGDL